MSSPASTASPTLQRLARIALARQCWQWLLAVLLVVICYLAFSPRPPTELTTGWDKLNHAAAFMALTFSACLAFAGRRWNVLWVMVAMLAFGGAIEVVQGFVPGRDSEWADLLADAVGIALGALVALPLLRAVSPRR